MKFLVDRYLLLPVGAVIALVWANTAGESYFRLAHALAFPVNEIGMALFLGLIAQELMDALLPGGALHSLRRWSVAVIAAAGGLAGATFAYLGYVQYRHELVLAAAWPVVGAIDIAAGYYVLKLVMPRSAAVPFFLITAAVTNVCLLAVVALRPGAMDVHPAGPGLIIVAVLAAAFARSTWRQWSVPPYAIVMALAAVTSWTGFYLAGLHPALALIPLVPFLPHEARREVFADVPDDGAVHHFEHRWNGIVQVVLLLFGFVNAGVGLGGADTGTWAVLVAVLVGRPVGMLVAVAAAEVAGLGLPSRLAWRHLLIVALACSSGFTFALFLASSVLPIGGVLAQIKLGALASVAGAVLALLAGMLFRHPRGLSAHLTGSHRQHRQHGQRPWRRASRSLNEQQAH